MLIHEGTLFLTSKEAIRLLKVSERYLWKVIKSDQYPDWQSIKKPKGITIDDGSKVLIAYEPLTDKYRDLVWKAVGDPYEYVKNQQNVNHKNIIEQLWIIDKEEREEIRKIQKLTSADVDKVAKAAAVARWYNSIKPSEAKNIGFTAKEDLLVFLHKHREVKQTPLWKSSKQWFKRQFGAYKKQGWKAFVHGNLGNDNAQVLDEVQRAIVKELYLKPWKLNMKTCFEDYKYVCERNLGVNPAGYSTVKRYLSTNDVQDLAHMIRHGQHAYETFVRPFVFSQEPEFSFSLIGSDGFWPSVSVQVPDNSIHVKHRGKVRTYVVWLNYDYKSKAILSWEVAPTETYDLFRLSMHRLLRIHGDKCPLSVILDKNMSEHKETNRLCKQLNMVIENKRPYNPKSNIAERGNKEFKKHFQEYWKYWVDTSFDMAHTINYQHNKEWIRQAAKGEKVITEQQFLEMIDYLVNAYNAECPPKLKGMSRLEYCYDNIHPQVAEFNALSRITAFGQVTRLTVKNNFYLTLQLHGKEHHYEIPWLDLDERPQDSKRVRVWYDETNMDEVAVYRMRAEDGKAKSHDAGIEHDVWLCNCKKLKKVSRAAVEHKPGDKEILDQQYGRGAKHDKVMHEKLHEHNELIEKLGLSEEIEQANQNRKKEAISKSVLAAAYTFEHQQSKDKYVEDEYLNGDWGPVEQPEDADFDDEYLF